MRLSALRISKMRMQDALKVIDASVPTPDDGLPEEVFVLISKWTPLVNVDLLIKDNEGRTLLTWRDDIYYEPGWHIPGGIIRFKETFEQRIHAVAKNELGAAVKTESLPLSINQTIHPTRRERGHFISLLFHCTLTTPPDKRTHANKDDLRAGQWEWHKSPPKNLITVHEIYRNFI